jgi:hypothetical protein
VQGRDCSLHLIRAGTLVSHRLVDQCEAFTNHAVIPVHTILVLEQDKETGCIIARGQARVLQELQCQ